MTANINVISTSNASNNVDSNNNPPIQANQVQRIFVNSIPGSKRFEKSDSDSQSSDESTQPQGLPVGLQIAILIGSNNRNNESIQEKEKCLDCCC